MRFRGFIAALGLAFLVVASAGAGHGRAALFEEAPGGPIPLSGAPSSLVGEDEDEGFTGGSGFGSVLVGFEGGRRAEVLWNNRRGVRTLKISSRPLGAGLVIGGAEYFGVIEARRRVMRLYSGSGSSYRPTQVLPTGVEPVAAWVNSAYGDAAILNRGSADLWIYESEQGRAMQLVAKVPLGGRPSDVATEFPISRPVFVSDAATDSVTELTDLEGGAYKFVRTIHVGGEPVALALGDYVSDGGDEFEVAVANRRSDTVTILDGPPGADYSYPYRAIGTYPAGDEPVAVHTVDIDGKDGQDLAVVDAGSDRLTILLNDGHGHFHRAGSYPTGREPVAVAPISFNRYFRPDLVVANRGSHDLTVLLRHQSAVCRGHDASPITGTAGDDLLVGRGDPDLIRGLGGDDRLLGNRGADCLYGGPGDDYLRGNELGDLLYGGAGSDRIYGNGGDDVVHAVDGQKDTVDCGGGVDTAYVDPEDVVTHCEHLRLSGSGRRR